MQMSYSSMRPIEFCYHLCVRTTKCNSHSLHHTKTHTHTHHGDDQHHGHIRGSTFYRDTVTSVSQWHTRQYVRGTTKKEHDIVRVTTITKHQHKEQQQQHRHNAINCKCHENHMHSGIGTNSEYTRLKYNSNRGVAISCLCVRASVTRIGFFHA